MSKRKAGEHLGLISSSAIETPLDCDDLLIEILLRVPVKSVIRLKCVCKHWLNLTSNPTFSQAHAHRNTCSPSGLYLYTVPSFDRLSPVPLHDNKSLPTLSFLLKGALEGCSFRILDSRCGLLLCSHENSVPLCYTVANPSTQTYKIIHLPPPTRMPNEVYEIFIDGCLAFDPTISLHYNVVILRQYYIFLKEIDVYSSKYEDWRRVNVDKVTNNTKTFFWNKAVYWTTYEDTYIQFDVDTGELVEKPLPHEVCNYEGGDHFLSGCYDNLIMVVQSSTYKMGFAIFEMRMGTHLWKLKKKVHDNTLEQFGLSNVAYIRVLDVHESEIVIALFGAGGVYSYNTTLNTLKVLYYTSSFRASVFAHYFIESLVPV